MENDEKRIEFDGRKKEELLKYKEEILGKVAEVIENGGPFLILGNTKNEQLVTMGGGESLVTMIASAMARVNELKRILEISIEAYEYAEEQVERRSKRSLSDKLIEALGCDTCPKKEDCDIFKSELVQDVEPTLENLAKLINDLHKKHPEIVHLMGKKGEC